MEKLLMLGKTEGHQRREDKKQRIRRLDGIAESTDMNVIKLRETLEDRGA